MLANSRAAAVIEVADLLAGMYIYSWERLSKYWDEDHREKIESMLQQICQISPQRWNYWIEIYEQKRRDGEEQRGWLPRGNRRSHQPEKTPGHSAALASLKQAEEIAPSRDGEGRHSGAHERMRLVMHREDPRSEVSRKLAAAAWTCRSSKKMRCFPGGRPRLGE